MIPARLPSLYITEEGRERDISDDYMLLQKQVGEPGQFGTVYSCIRLTDRKPCAVKVIDKNRFISNRNVRRYFENFKAEIDLQRKMDHPNIVELYDVYESRDELMLVMEMCCGGELFERIADRASEGRGYSERLAATILKQVLSAVAFMHSNNICHCDLKPSNILFDTNAEHAQVKVIDFGFAQRVPRWKRYLTKSCGTPFYTAPEVLNGRYNKEADMWSIGIIMFAMFFGFTPFQKAGDERLGTRAENMAVRRRILLGYKGIPRRGRISSAAKRLIHSLLKMDVVERYTADQALMHIWFESASEDDEIPDTVLQKLRKVTAMDNFKVFVLSAFRDDTDLATTAQLKKYFERFDRNRDNRISLQEFEDGLRTYLPELRGRDVRQMFDKLDIDGDNYIQFDEFWSLIAYQQLISAYERLAVVFDGLDKNKNGYLDRGDIPELKRAMKSDPLMRRLDLSVEDVIDSADLDNDGQVSFDEFLFAMHPELVEPNKREWFESKVTKKRPSQESKIRMEPEEVSPRRSQPQTQVRSQQVEDFEDKPLRQNSFDRILTKVWSQQKSSDSPKSRQNEVLMSSKSRFQDKRYYEEEEKNYKRRADLSISRPKSLGWDEYDEKDENLKKTWYACS